MSKTLIGVADTVFPSLEPARQALGDIDAEIHVAMEPTPEAILEVAQEADALFVTYAKITGDMIFELKRCQVIGRFGVGTDNIDIDAATRAGIMVTYAPVYCLDEVSDHTLALLLALARKIPYAHSLVNNRRWEMKAVVPINRLKGRILGLVGFGNIAQGIVSKARAFGIKTIAADPYVSDEEFTKLDVERVDFDQLLEQADFISIHTPLTDETTNLFGKEAFMQMKPEALLINTARGPLVDIDALAQALEAGEIAGAALDVLPQEPPPDDCPLFGRDDVILTPHTGFYSADALLDLQTTVAADVASVLNGESPRFPVNPEVRDLK